MEHKDTEKLLERGSGVTGTGSSSREPRIHSQHPHSSSQLAVYLVLGQPIAFLALTHRDTHGVHTWMYVGKTPDKPYTVKTI